jgi:hypothetical protein
MNNRSELTYCSEMVVNDCFFPNKRHADQLMPNGMVIENEVMPQQ